MTEKEKLPWGLKQVTPGSMKNMSKDKLEAFDQGNVFNKKNLSKKELEEMKKKVYTEIYYSSLRHTNNCFGIYSKRSKRQLKCSKTSRPRLFTIKRCPRCSSKARLLIRQTKVY
jgi:hypothetical protein